MVSNSKITKARRVLKTKKAGAKRKTENRNKGTTPKFKIHEETEKK